MKILIAHFATHWVNTSGGMEKVTCQFANAMEERGHDVTIWYIGGEEGCPYFPLNEKIKTRNILFENGKQVVSEKLPLHLRMYREISRIFSQKKAQAINAEYKGRMYGKQIRKYLNAESFDVVVSCSEQSAKYLITDGKCTIPVIEMIHTDPKVDFPKLSKLEIEAISKCRILQVLTESGREIAKRYFPLMDVRVIGNVVLPAKQPANPGIEKKEHIICCVGVLSHNKNQKILLSVWKKLAFKYKNWKIEIWGDANTAYGQELQKMIKESHLESCVQLKGKTNEIEKIYANGDIFVIPSHSEGWGLALTEAMAAGLPTVGFKTCGGVNELIKDGETGYLTEPDVESFCAALRKLMDNAKLREDMGLAGKRSISQYAPEIIWEIWENLLKSVQNKI